jgi:AcrR family transcriptional regulator
MTGNHRMTTFSAGEANMGKGRSERGDQPRKERRKHGRGRAPKSEHTRQQILEAALKLFRRKGYPGTSMTDIADAVGLTKGGLYHHVDKKGDLLRELHDEMVTAMFDRVKRNVDPEPDSKKQLATWIRMHASIMHDYLDQIAVFFTEMEHLDKKTLKRIIPRRDEFLRRLAEILRTGAERGDFREDLDPDITALLILGTLNWFYMWYRPKGRLSVDEIADVAIALVCHGVYKEEKQETK